MCHMTKYSLAKTGDYPRIFPNFQNCTRCEKDFKDNKTIVAIWRENMHEYLSADIICSEKRTVFRERNSRKTVSYEEQIMFKDKYPSIFSSQMVTIVFIIPQIFFATPAVLKIGEYSWIFFSFSWGILSHVTRLDQSRAGEKIWWIIMAHNLWCSCQWKLSNGIIQWSSF